jgi:hypothetical protein
MLLYLCIPIPQAGDLATIAICEVSMVITTIKHNNEGRNNMITQGIKRWLYKLFAWWPWKKTPVTNYTQTVSNSNKSTAQEMMIWMVDGPLPQSGITSVVIEQEHEDHITETDHPTNDDRAVHPAQTGPSLSAEEPTHQTQQRPDSRPAQTQQTQATEHVVDPVLEQKLTFLKFLIHKGQINEGFEEGQTPEQYRNL